MKPPRTGVLGIYNYLDLLIAAIEHLRAGGFQYMQAISPVPNHDIDEALAKPASPVRVFTLIGGLIGFATGWALTIGAVRHYPIIVGGKPLISLPTFLVVAYILTILFGALATLIGMLLNARLPRAKIKAAFDPRLSADHFGLVIYCPPELRAEVERKLLETGAEEVRHVES